MDLCIGGWMVSSIRTLLVALFIIFAPIKAAIITVSVLVIMDLVLGMAVSLKAGRKITSDGMKRTCIKLGVYELTILLSFLVETFLSGSLVPVSKIATTIIGLTELKSVMENLDLLAGGSLLNSFIRALQVQASAQEQPQAIIASIEPIPEPPIEPEPPKAA